MSANKRNEYEIQKDDKLISELYLKGYSYRKIAEIIAADTSREYTLSHVQIGHDVKRMLASWKEAREANIDEWVTGELEKLAKLEQTYWEAWEKTVKDWTKVSVKNGDKGGQKFSEDTMTDVKMFGDPRYLQGIERCIQKRCELLGLDAPKEIHVKTNIENTHFVLNEHPQLKKVS